MSLRPQNPRLSAIVPAYNEGAGIADFLQALHHKLTQHSSDIEIIVINDGSRDDTSAQVLAMAQHIPCIKLLDFSRNFGKEAALTAGIDHAEGDAVIIIDADFQHPINTVDAFIQKWHEGYDMAYGLRTDRATESGVKRAGVRLFYWLLDKMSSVNLPEDAGDFRLLDRRVVLALRQLPERSRFMKGLYSWVGFRTCAVPFQVQERSEGDTAYTFGKLVQLALTGLVSFSDVPLRMWTFIGLFISSVSLFYALYIIVDTLAFGADTNG